MAASIKRGAIAALSLVALAGCAQVRDHKGYIVDTTLINTVQPGVDNKDSVNKTLGRPTFDSAWDGSNTWYYLARDTRSLAFSTPKPVTQTLLAVRFAANGDVASVQRTGVETVRDIQVYGRKTPVLGSHRSFFSELFGNIAPGTTDKATTADNPGG
ncbi:MAG TPA: outer membrane protein assembly factor BamE [Sphingomonas sp.]|uniref:outer membrane protein assembly factor BamE n=1 Tax=Sphingomonas sp. TaxID=28214 RepID=UPI002D0AC5B4|nr:outer membrane protein assembly factor BamE [Sphingomonas sp.]HMI21090.1 outer membrane protein assembly factor BamE [Sphingomonas sp.]